MLDFETGNTYCHIRAHVRYKFTNNRTKSQENRVFAIIAPAFPVIRGAYIYTAYATENR
jgi:hypothetical protein